MPISCQIYIEYKLGVLMVSKVIVVRIIPNIVQKPLNNCTFFDTYEKAFVNH